MLQPHRGGVFTARLQPATMNLNHLEVAENGGLI
jgi:hypothetical protein